MLTLKAPLQLHTAQPLTAQTDAFSERIRGNYGLLGAHFTPKDLLFFMTAPPELPEDLGGMTTLVNQQTQVDLRSVSMDVVNNVVNRILLDGTQSFTYQDQVYITTVLNRMGITHVAQFMEQVRRLRVENESSHYLTQLYHSELERVLQRQAAGEAVPRVSLPSPEAEDAPQPPADPRVTLCMEILNRLDTPRIYQTVLAFQRSWSNGDVILRNQELRLSEQLRFSTQVALAETKQQLFQQPRLELLHHLNLYEAGVDLEPPRTEEAVLSQAAAAALLAAVDSTVVQVLNRPQYRAEQWVQTQNALWQVAENALSRFETYHTQTNLLLPRETEREHTRQHYTRELLEYRALRQLLHPEDGEAPEAPPVSGVPAPAQPLIWNQTVEGDKLLEQTYTQTLSEALPQPPRTGEQPPLPPSPVPLTAREAEEQAPELLVQEMNRIDQHNRTLLQALQTQAQQQVPVSLTEPDLRQTMRSALRALDEPETVLRELRESQERQQAQILHPTLSPQEELLLQQANPQERALYETILEYQKDPERALAKGWIRPASQAALLADLQAQSQTEPLPLEHPAPEETPQELVRQQAQSVLEKMIHVPGPRPGVVEETLPPSAVRIVHKQAAPDVTEELLEQFSQQRRTQALHTETTEQVTRQQSHQVDVKQIEKKVVSQTTEDLTELVNRTLAQQMRTISDQVYRQMEKRLQTERSRRGRL